MIHIYDGSVIKTWIFTYNDNTTEKVSVRIKKDKDDEMDLQMAEDSRHYGNHPWHCSAESGLLDGNSSLIGTRPMNLKNIYLRLIALGDDPDDSHMVELQAHIDAPDDQAGMLTAFRHAANSLGIEAGVIVSHVPHADAQASITGDHYFLELISEAELRFRKLSVRYERLRAAAIWYQRCFTSAIVDPEFSDDSEIAAGELKEALGDG
jgi:hypothetical protein